MSSKFKDIEAKLDWFVGSEMGIAMGVRWEGERILSWLDSWGSYGIVLNYVKFGFAGFAGELRIQ